VLRDSITVSCLLAFYFIFQDRNALVISRLQWLISAEGEVTQKFHIISAKSVTFHFGFGGFRGLKRGKPTLGAWLAGSATYDVSVTPMQYEAGYRRKTVSASAVKCSSLLPDFDQSCAGCDTLGGSAMCDVWVTPLQCRRSWHKEILRPHEKSALNY
jgi:hypothetical protein